MREINRGVAVLRPGAALLAALLLIALGACEEGDPNTKVNGDVHVHAGVAATGANSINGSITVDDGASFTDANTVNGSITVGDKATGASLRTVNGRSASARQPT